MIASAYLLFLLIYSYLLENNFIFKPGAPAAGRLAPGFLKLFLYGRLYVCVCVCVCVSAP